MRPPAIVSSPSTSKRIDSDAVYQPLAAMRPNTLVARRCLVEMERLRIELGRERLAAFERQRHRARDELAADGEVVEVERRRASQCVIA